MTTNLLPSCGLCVTQDEGLGLWVVPGRGILGPAILPAEALLIVDCVVVAACVSAETAELTLGLRADMRRVVPAGLYSRARCRWRFRGPECGYGGAATDCDRSIEACIERGNIIRYGGFPGIPRGLI